MDTSNNNISSILSNTSTLLSNSSTSIPWEIVYYINVARVYFLGFTIFVYSLFVYVILWNRSVKPVGAQRQYLCVYNALTSPYFTLILWLAACDLCVMAQWPTYWCWIMISKQPSFQWLFTYDYIWLRVFHFLWGVCFKSNYVLVLGIAVNRYTATCRPSRHDKLWSSHLRHWLCLSFTIGVSGSWPYLCQDLQIEWTGRFKPVNQSATAEQKALGQQSMFINFKQQPWYDLDQSFSLAITAFVAMSSSVIYAIVFRRLYEQSRSHACCNSADMLKAARRLAIIGIILMVPSWIMIISWIRKLLGNPASLRPYFSMLTMLLSTSYLCANPYVVTLLSTDMQHAFVRVYQRIKDSLMYRADTMFVELRDTRLSTRLLSTRTTPTTTGNHVQDEVL